MNNKLRALCKDISKSKIVKSVPIPEDDKVAKEDTFAASLARKRLMEESQIGDSNDGAISDPNYKMSELERKRRLLTKYRESTSPSENLTPYELAIREQKRDDEKKKERGDNQKEKSCTCGR